MEIGAEEFHGDAGLCTREHGIDTVGDGRPHLYIHPRQFLQPLTHVGNHLVFRPPIEHKGSLNLRVVHAQGMLVQFGASRLSAHGLYLWNRQEGSLRPSADAVRLVERDAGQRTDVDGEGALVEGGQETASEREHHHQGQHQRDSRCGEDGLAMAQGEETHPTHAEPFAQGETA